METENLVVIVEMAGDGTYDCYPEEDERDIGLAGYGNSAKEAIDDFLQAYQETKEDNEKEGKPTPEFNFEFKYDIRSFFNYFNFFNVSKIAKLAGINNAQLNQYLTGTRNASQMQYDKLTSCIKKITADLETARF